VLELSATAVEGVLSILILAIAAEVPVLATAVKKKVQLAKQVALSL
jgi:hypothetical protein